MRYGKRWSILERWKMDSEALMGIKPKARPKSHSTGEEISFDVIDFAEDFFHLSMEDVVNLSGDKLKALVEMERFFGDGMSLEKLEIICDDGFGESFEEMFAIAKGGSLFPKLARDYAEMAHMIPWEELPPMDLNHECDCSLLWEAYEEKYGPLDES